MSSFGNRVCTSNGQAQNAPGLSALERLPYELLLKILSYVAAPKQERYWFNAHTVHGDSKIISEYNLQSCLLVSKRMGAAATFLTYREPSLNPQSSRPLSATSLEVFFTAVTTNSRLGNLVRTLEIQQNIPNHQKDFSMNVLSLSTLLPRLRDLRISLGHLPCAESLKILLFDTASLESLSINIDPGAGFYSEKGSSILRTTFDFPSETSSNLISLRIAGSSSRQGSAIYIPDTFFATLLPRMVKLRVLDLCFTTVTSESLASLPSTSRLTHLDLSHCSDLQPGLLTNFLSTHDAITSSLHTLNVSNTSYDNLPTFQEREINALLASAPKTLRSLNLSESFMGQSNVSHLQRLCTQLEELSFGSGLSLREVEEIILAARYAYELGSQPSNSTSTSTLDFHSTTVRSPEKGIAEMREASVLGPMKAAVARCKLHQRLNSIRAKPGRDRAGNPPCFKLRYLNLSCLARSEKALLKQSVLLSEQAGLDVIEASQMEWDDFVEVQGLIKCVGWKEEWVGERMWLEKV